jgi:hypothetical protein
VIRVDCDGASTEVQLVLEGVPVRCIAADGDRMIVGTQGAGALLSSDGGRRWERMELPARNVFSVAIGPADGTLYAGAEPSRVFVLRDGAEWTELDALQDIPSRERWSFPPRPWTHHVRWIAPDPHRRERLIVAIELGGVMLSEDGGESATVRFVPESRSQQTHRTFDLPGAVSVTAGLVVLVFAIVKSNTYGWGSPRTIGLLAAGVVLLAGFLEIESRSSAPLMRLSIFRLRGLAAADLTLLLTAAAVFATFFFVSLYLQQILGYRPLRAGAAFLPFSAGIATGATVARKLVPRLGVRDVPVIGLAIATVGMIVLTQLPVHGRYTSNLLPGLVPLGLGLGLTFVPITLAATSEVRGDDAGLASGLLNTAQQVGGSIGLAVLATLAASRTTSLLHGPVTPGSVLAARVSGFHVAFIAAAVLLGAAWTVAALQLRTRRVREPRRMHVPRDLAARAVGCAQCAPVAVTDTRGRQTSKSADDPTTARAP